MSGGGDASVFRPGGITYLRIPATDPARAAIFYEHVFRWAVDLDRDGFEDIGGHVIGHFVSDQAVAGAAGVRPYIYVEDVDATLERVRARGGEVATAPYPEGDLTVATFRDPEGNVVGLWQRGAPAA